MATYYFCAATSKQLNESVFGTCPVFDNLILIEYPYAWDNQAIINSKLDEDIKLHLSNFTNNFLKTKIFFIKKENLKRESNFVLYLVKNTATKATIKKIILETHNDILNLDFAKLFNSEFSDFDNKPLFLVCTNGRHDKCCSKFGVPIYNQLQKLVREQAWQCTHIGGDRFAPNLVVVPYLLFYGSVSIEDLPILVQLTSKQKVFLNKLRGRSCNSIIEQAAEYYLRKEENNIDIFDYEILNSKEISPKLFEVEFKNSKTGKTKLATIKQDKESTKRRLTCDADKEQYPRTYQLMRIE